MLYIDDCAIDHKIIACYCERLNVKLVTTFFAEDGLEIIKKNKPFFVLCDINLYGLDGWDFIQQVRLDAELVSIPIALTTAYESIGILERARAAGVVGVLFKPISPEQLKRLLQDSTNMQIGHSH